MKILSLSFCNLNSLKGTFFIDFSAAPFESAGLFAVTGPTGAGKSTVFDALSLGLYGETPRLKKNRRSGGEGIFEIVSRHTAEAWAEVEFRVPAGRYRSRWETHRARGSVKGAFQQPRMRLSRLSGDPDSPEELVEDKLSEVPARIAVLTGLDFDRFTRSMLLAQGAFSAFLEAPPAERAELLEKMTGSFIYSEVSRLAFERARDEEQKEQELKTRRDGIELLDDLQLQEMLGSLKELEIKRTAAVGRRDLLIASIEKARQRGELTGQLSNVRNTLKELDSRLPEMEELSNALERHGKVLPVQGELKRLDSLETELAERSRSLNELSGTCRSLQEKELQLEVTSRAAAAAVDELKRNRDDVFRVLGTAEKLESSLDELKQRLSREWGLRKGLEEKKAGRSVDLQGIKTRMQELKRLHAEADKIIGNTALRDLADGITLLRIRLDEAENLSGVLRSLKSDKDEYTARLVRIGQSGLTSAEEEQEAGTVRKRLSEIGVKLGSLPGRSEAALKARQLEENLNRLKTAGEGRERLNFLEKEISSRQTAIEELDRNIIAVNQEALELELKLSALRRDSLDSAARELRNELCRGKPCPVCGSREHPSAGQAELFSSEEGEPGIEASVPEDYRVALVHRTELEERRRNLAERNNETRAEAEILREETGASAQADEESLYKEQLLSLQDGLAARDLLENEQTELFGRLNALTEAAAVKNRELQQQQNEEALIRERLERIERERESTQTRLDRAKEYVSSITGPAGIDPEADGLGAQLDSASAGFRRVEEESRALAEEERALRERASITEAELTDTDAQLHEADLQISQLERRRDERLAELEELTGGISSGELAVQVKNQLDAAEAESLSLGRELASVREQRAGHEGSRAAAEEHLLRSRREYSRLNGELEKTSTDAGFRGLKDFREALMDNAGTMRTQLEKFTAERDKQLQSSARIEAEIEALPAQTADGEALDGELKGVDGELEKLQQGQFEFKQKLDRDRENRRLNSDLEAELSAQQKELETWWRLRKIIGSARGDSFRRFAQGLTLDFLIRLANSHLGRFSGRYRLQRQTGDELALEIIDTWQADTVRPVATLSGGETFLVSLSLALGLSELAGRKTRIESLFLDEGFGTLDAVTLETVLAALDTLQSGGKLIGVISHVEVLKERIPVQIRITRRGAGSSTLSVVPEPG